MKHTYTVFKNDDFKVQLATSEPIPDAWPLTKEEIGIMRSGGIEVRYYHWGDEYKPTREEERPVVEELVAGEAVAAANLDTLRYSYLKINTIAVIEAYKRQHRL